MECNYQDNSNDGVMILSVLFSIVPELSKASALLSPVEVKNFGPAWSVCDMDLIIYVFLLPPSSFCFFCLHVLTIESENGYGIICAYISDYWFVSAVSL